MMHQHGQMLTVVACVDAFLIGAMPATPIAAQPVSDVRDVKVKVRNFKAECKATGGTATSRPSALDADKYITNCKGGTFDGQACIYTPTTSDCFTDRTDSKQPGTVSQVDDNLGVTRATGVRSARAWDHGLITTTTSPGPW